MRNFGMFLGWIISKAIIVYIIVNGYFAIRDKTSLLPELATLFAFLAWRNTMRLAYGQVSLYERIEAFKKEAKENINPKFYRLKGE